MAHYVPCAAHSLNLVGQSAAGCCQLAVEFFDFLQRLYTFFAVLVKAYEEINSALEEIADDVEQKPDCRQEACGLAAYMNRLETGILAALWYHILHRFHGSSQVLQSADQDLNTAVAIYESLVDFIRKLRTRFDEFEAKGKKLSECENYMEEVRRVRQRNRCYDEPGSAPELPQTPADKFRTRTFLVIVDSIVGELQKRLGAYDDIAAKFGFLQNLKDLSADQVVKSADSLQKAYPTDLEDSLSDELVHFSSFLNTEFVKKALSATTSPAIPAAASSTQATTKEPPDGIAVITKDDDDVRLNVESLELRMYKILVDNKLETLFPNTFIPFRIYLSLMISNCSGERSFSTLKRIKSQVRLSMTQKRLNSLTLLSVDHELLWKMDFSSLINDLAIQKSHKHNVYKASGN